MIAPPVVILAGGASRRMGAQDKALALLDNRPLWQHVRDRVEPQGGALAINSNGARADFAASGLPVLPDTLPDRPGPLAGLLTAMLWATDAPYVVTVPADAPFLPGDLIPCLLLAADAPAPNAAFATCAGRAHPTCGLWPTHLAPRLERAIVDGMRRMMEWVADIDAREAQFPATDPDPFFNMNTPDDLARAQTYLSGQKP